MRPFVLDLLSEDVRVDATKQQVAGDSVTWTVRASRGSPEARIEGIVNAQFRGGKIKTFELGPGTPAATETPYSGSSAVVAPEAKKTQAQPPLK